MIETKDLILDKAKYEDWQAMYHNVWSRPQSFRYMVLELSPNETEAQERMRRTIRFQAERKTAYTIFLKSTREAIGFAGIAQLEGNTWEETGICLGPDFWGKGYGTQVLDCLLRHAKELGAQTFLYSSWEENRASRALAERAGFAQYTTEHCIRTHDGQEYELVKYLIHL